MKSPRRLVLKARYVFPVSDAPLAGGCVVVEGDRIIFVGESDSCKRGAVDEECDLGNAAVLPGLVNAHAHLEFSDLAAPLGRRGIGFVDWIELVIAHRRLAAFSPDEAVAAGLRESLGYGVTALGDIIQPGQPSSNSPPETDRFLELKAFTAAGVAGAMETARRHVVSERGGLCPHAPHTVHPDLLKAVVELSAAERVPVAMHLAESAEEMEFLLRGRGPFRGLLEKIGIQHGTLADHYARPLDYLRVLAGAHRALVVHGNYLDDEEIEFVGAHAERMSVVYCPRSHDWFLHAGYPLGKLLSAGASMALGTDGRCSTPDLSVLEEMRFAARRHPNVALDAILRLGTLGGAKALGRETEIGSISPGKLANLAIVALPDRQADDPHELIFDSSEPIAGCYYRGVECRL